MIISEILTVIIDDLTNTAPHTTEKSDSNDNPEETNTEIVTNPPIQDPTDNIQVSEADKSSNKTEIPVSTELLPSGRRILIRISLYWNPLQAVFWP